MSTKNVLRVKLQSKILLFQVLEKKTTVGISFVAKDDPAAALQDTNEANPKHGKS